MSRESNDSIEQFFQKATRQYPAEFNEGDWRKMEKMLEEEAARAAAIRARWWRWGGALLAGLAVVTTTYLFFSESSPTPEPPVENGQVTEAAAEPPGTEGTTLNAGEGSDEDRRQTRNTGEGVDENERAVASGPEGAGDEEGTVLKNTGAGEQQPATTIKEQTARAGIDHTNAGIDKTNVGKSRKGEEVSSGLPLATVATPTGRDHDVDEDTHRPLGGDRQTGNLQNGIAGDTDRQARKETDKTSETQDKQEQEQEAVDERQELPIRVEADVAKTTPAQQSEEQSEAKGVDAPGGTRPPLGEGNKNVVRNDAVAAGEDREETGLPAGAVAQQGHEDGEEVGKDQAKTKETGDGGMNDREAGGGQKKLQPAATTQPGQAADIAAGQDHNRETDSISTITAGADSLAEDAAGTVTNEDDSEQDRRVSRWSVAFVVSPDFNRTPASDYTGSGDAFGVMASYHIFDRWRISTGALRSSKKYWGYGDEYSPPEGYWNAKTNGVVPEKVDGNCVVLEIPLSLAYNVLRTKRSNMFVSAGVSSYLMLSEKYWYTFQNPDPGWAKGWATDKSSSYALSIGVLSLGYEYLVLPDISIGLEPYYKMPFGGIGWANINLYSAGAYFSVRYRF